MTSASPLSPTFYGHIASTQDALLLFEACLSGALSHVARRPHDRERAILIKSGNIFIYEEHSSGIRRWTDGIPWSPSRILGNFLVYRELERPFPPGEKKKAIKRSRRSPYISNKGPYRTPSSGIGNSFSTASATTSNFDSPSSSSLSRETERSLVGSLVDSYGFKEEGLVKKTLSVTVKGVSHHLVSYYTVTDIMNSKFCTPSKDPRFQHITPRPDLVTKQNFRTSIDEVEPLDRMDDRSMYDPYSYPCNGYEMANHSIAHRPMLLQSSPTTHVPTAGYNSYVAGPNSGPYNGFSTDDSMNVFSSQFAPVPGIYLASKAENFNLSGRG